MGKHMNIQWQWCCKKLSRAWREEEGAAGILVLFFLLAGIAAAGFMFDSTRMGSDAARLKAATDAAAQAIALESAKDSDTDLNAMAARYVEMNLGLDDKALREALRVSIEPTMWHGYDGYRVRASFRAQPRLLGGKSRTVEVASAAVAVYHPLEVAFVAPSTMNESEADMSAIRDIGEAFFDRLIDRKPDRWMALVPYSDGVNVWDDEKGVSRIRAWAMPGRLDPPWLRYIKKGAGITNLASPRMPDVRKKILHVDRGMLPGEVFKWKDPPEGSFEIRVQDCVGGNCIMSNYPPGWPYIEWTGPTIPGMGNGITGPVDVRRIAADNTVPLTPLLPLTDDREKFVARLAKMIPDHNEMSHAINLNIAMGWGAMALSPGFRGIEGWGDLDHPMDFSEDGRTTVKAVIAMVSFNGPLWDIDEDSNNFYLDWETLGGGETFKDPDFVRDRIKDLCDDFRATKDFHFFLLVIPAITDESGKRRYDKLWPTLSVCGRRSGDVQKIETPSFAEGKTKFINALERIATDLEGRSGYVRLVE